MDTKNIIIENFNTNRADNLSYINREYPLLCTLSKTEWVAAVMNFIVSEAGQGIFNENMVKFDAESSVDYLVADAIDHVKSTTFDSRSAERWEQAQKNISKRQMNGELCTYNDLKIEFNRINACNGQY